MKKLFLYIIFLSAMALINLSCKKEKTKPKDTFCTAVGSDIVSNIEAELGTVLFSVKMNRYYIRLANLPPDSEYDRYFAAYPCTLVAEFKKDGLKVIVSGILKEFNATQTIIKNTPGEIPYYFELSSIKINPVK